ncbi:MAG: agmatinase [Candidatus Latescibacteria bacterium]|nr:agmatinase [Candidatus Latescibacterota bacterium]
MIFDFANAKLKKAQTVILGIPFDRSSSYVPGNRFGASFARIGSCNVESYSPYFNQDLSNYKIHDAGDLALPYSSVIKTFRQIQKTVRKYTKLGKHILSIGGEHTVTIPIVKELVTHYPELRIIQFDAHSDTRDQLLGDKYSHATVIKRISEFIPADRIYQLGLRSITRPVENQNQYLFSVLKYLDQVKNRIGHHPCYLTLDIDVLDCGIFPAVQTPVPNGISYQELFASIVKLSELDMVGCDIVEYNPTTSANLTYASVVAEIIRELILMMNQVETPKI